ncbi:MAG: hypothetical protein KAS32_14920 [Candidatus Peribacteraceae bacterium]|nr:hypothetical protein [Candidatus Peribacteraceae bacterium]
MNKSIRKDNKVSANTLNNVVVLGTVTGVRGMEMTVKTIAGVEHTVQRVTATKLTAADFKAMVAESSQPKVKAKSTVKVNNTKKPNKKAAARDIFVKLVGKSRKEVIAAFKSEIGLSGNGASTYYQNFKSGTWATK